MTFIKKTSSGLLVPRDKKIEGVSGGGLTSGLISYWPLQTGWTDGNSDAIDKVRNVVAADGNSPTPGASNTAFAAADSDYYYSTSTCPPITGARTISCLISASNVGTTQVGLYLQSGSTIDYCLVGFYSTTVVISCAASTAASRISSVVSNSTEYHVVIRKIAGNVLDLWVNGVNDTKSSAVFFQANTTSVMFGGSITAGSYTAGQTGTLGHIMVWSRHLTAGEIKTLYARGGKLL